VGEAPTPSRTALMVCSPVSATYKVAPSGAMATPLGLEKVVLAQGPTPPGPASVLNTPVPKCSTLTLKLFESAMYRRSFRKDRPVGVFRLAAVPAPLAKAGAPLPASVDVSAEGRSTRLMRWLLLSATYTAEAFGSTAMPCGRLNRARRPAPSTHPKSPLPLTVVTLEPTALRNRWPPQSVKYSVKVGSAAAMPRAEGFTLASAPMPSTDPALDPATVATAEAHASTTRSLSEPVSPTKRRPLASSAMPGKALALATPAVPSVLPPTPEAKKYVDTNNEVRFTARTRLLARSATSSAPEAGESASW